MGGGESGERKREGGVQRGWGGGRKGERQRERGREGGGGRGGAVRERERDACEWGVK
jgi:hypothetical protein